MSSKSHARNSRTSNKENSKYNFQIIPKYHSDVSKIIIDAYISRTLNENSKTIVQYEGPQHVILTARPDEFEKLPPKCSACGIVMQTDQPNMHGFVPPKKFLDASQKGEVNRLVCYSCYQLRHANKEIMPRLSNNQVLEQLKHIDRRKALILYVVDMFDIEGTMFTDLLKYVGEKKRIIIVGNKIDRVPQDSKPVHQLERMKDTLKDMCMRNGLDGCNFRDICLVSARSGYGMSALVEKVNKHRMGEQDVYLVGCANVGKSTLYNLLSNLLTVHKNDRMPPQAIEHHLPGTTASLVRESIGLRKLQKLEWRLKNGPWDTQEVFDFDDELKSLLGVEPESETKSKQVARIETKPEPLKPMKLEFVSGKEKEIRQTYLYDTPGIINESQILQYLNSKEINYLSPTSWIVPRTYMLKPGQCLFVGGLARLDFININRTYQEDESKEQDMDKGAQSIYVTLFCSPNVPGHVTISSTAEEKYEKLFGTEVFKIPIGSEGRREEFPDFKGHEYSITGIDMNTSTADLVMHGVGWVSIAAVVNAKVHLALHTPNGIGQSFRYPAMLPYSIRQKGSRGKSYLGHPNKQMYGHTRKRSPQFIRVFQKQTEPVTDWMRKIKEKTTRERIETKHKERQLRLERGEVKGRMERLLKWIEPETKKIEQ